MQEMCHDLGPVAIDHVTQLKKSLFFDEEYYVSSYPDVALTALEPSYHFFTYGAALHRNPNRHFDTAEYVARHGLPRGAGWIDHYLTHFGRQRTDTKPFSPSDLKSKLWGGFSGIALSQMEAALSDPAYNPKQKAEIAYFLARWFASNGDWDRSVHYCRLIARFDRRFSRLLRPKLLYIEARIHVGEFSEAAEMIDFALAKSMDGNFTCAQMNLLRRQGRPAEARLASLNRLLAANDLLEVGLAEPSRPLVLGNLSCMQSETILQDGPVVSVLMPCFNAEPYLDIAMNSLTAQTWRNIEIIAVDDCSTDGTWRRLQDFAQADRRIKVFRNDRNMGAYPTRNRALYLASGEFVCVHDSDDWSHPQMIALQLQPMLEDTSVRGTCSAMVRAHEDLTFILRPQRDNLQYVHRSYPSLLMRRSDVLQLGEWDSVAANADDEFVQRARALWGGESLIDILPDVPLSMFLVHENSLTQQAGTSLNSLTFGVRGEYARQARYWRDTRGGAGQDVLKIARTDWKVPFPIPMGLAPKHWHRDTHYDLIIMSDLSLLGGTRRCNEAYIHAALSLGLRVGLFHWPRYDLRLAPIDSIYTELSYDPRVDFLVREDQVECGALLIHHPPILGFGIDDVPSIEADFVGIIVNQLPMQRWSQSPFYYDGPSVEALCERLFRRKPVWIAISERVRHCLRQIGGFGSIHSEIWYPPLRHIPDDASLVLPEPGSNRPIVAGRHARDHWTKWPALGADIAGAYCADVNGIAVHLLGSAGSAIQAMGQQPSNWTVSAFGSVDVFDFIASLDFLVHFVHEDYIEEFGRNVAEAMALGRVVILPNSFRDVFGNAAVYADAANVADVMKSIWSRPDVYEDYVRRGRAFVKSHCSPEATCRNLRSVLRAPLEAKAV